MDEEKEKLRLKKLYLNEEQCYAQNANWVAGVDEAGRGPLAGPVVAAAVILPREGLMLAGLNDSKLISDKLRQKLDTEIRANALIGIGEIGTDLIDKYNVYEATKMAMKKAIENLGVTPDFLLIDALKLSDVAITQLNIIKGDRKSASIAAASVIAKVYRDNLMLKLHDQFPQYGFAQHKGYGTKLHLEALKKFGPSPIHRRSFAPVKECEHGNG